MADIPGIRAQMRRLLDSLEREDAEASPTLIELWPAFQQTEVQYLRSSKRSEWAWSELRHLRGPDGVALQDRQAITITTEIVEDLRQQLRNTITVRGKPYSAATVNRHFIVLRRLLNWAHENKKIPHNPLPSLTMEPERNIRHARIRSEEELERLLSKCNRVVKALVLVLFDGGLRKSEALGLRRDQLVKKPNGGAVIELSSDETKNGRPRQPHITRRTVEALEAIPSGGQHYFAKPSGARFSPRYIYSLFERAAVAAGLRGPKEDPLTLHSLRHSFAYVRRARDHWPTQLIMRQGGWLTDSCLRRYGDPDHEEFDAAMASVEARIARDRGESPTGDAAEEEK